MKKLYLLFILLWFGFSVFAQDDNFTRAWGSYFNHARLTSIALDDEENLWVYGDVREIYQQFINPYITADAHQTEHGGKTDAFLAKFSSDGTLLYASYFGGEEDEDPGHIIYDDNKIYIVGATKSQTNIATHGSYQENLNSFDNPTWQSGYIAQFSTEGELQWSTYFQGNRSSFFYEIAAGLENDLFIWGTTKSSDLGTPGAFKENIPPPYTSNSGSEVYPNYPFLSRFDTDGNLIWSTYYGPDITSSQDDLNFPISFSGIGVDLYNNIYISGNSQDQQNYFGTVGTHQPEKGGGIDAFVAKFSDDGQRLWGTYFGGELNEFQPKLTVARKSNVFLTGITTSTTGIATPNSWQDSFLETPNNNSYIAEFDIDGQVVWSSYISPSFSYPHVNTDLNQNIYLYNMTTGHPPLITNGSYQENFGGDFDASLIKLNPSGNQVQWGSYYGGSEREDLFRYSNLLIDDNSNMYIIGKTKSDNMASTGAFQTNKTSSDFISFIAKFIPCPDIDSPIGNPIQYFNENETVQDLSISFIDWPDSDLTITYYADEEGNEIIPSETILEDGETYYIGQKIQGCKESELLAITVYLNLSVSASVFDNVQLYPNPSSGAFIIKGLISQTHYIELFDLQVRSVFVDNYAENTDEYHINLEGQLGSGLYFLKISTADRSKIFQVIVK